MLKFSDWLDIVGLTDRRETRQREARRREAHRREGRWRRRGGGMPGQRPELRPVWFTTAQSQTCGPPPQGQPPTPALPGVVPARGDSFHACDQHM